jgi:hypothetical protein
MDLSIVAPDLLVELGPNLGLDQVLEGKCLQNTVLLYEGIDQHHPIYETNYWQTENPPLVLLEYFIVREEHDTDYQ